MKITKQKLIEIIEQELEEVNGLAGGSMTGDQDTVEVGNDEPVEPEVADETAIGQIQKLLQKINKPEEYEAVLEMVIQHGNDITGKKDMLSKLDKQLPKYTATMQ